MSILPCYHAPLTPLLLAPSLVFLGDAGQLGDRRSLRDNRAKAPGVYGVSSNNRQSGVLDSASPGWYVKVILPNTPAIGKEYDHGRRCSDEHERRQDAHRQTC